MGSPGATLILASASPRRRELLASLGLPFRAVACAVDEAERAGEQPEAYLERIVGMKLEAARLGMDPACAAVLVADTTVVCEGAILGKPRDVAEARAMVASIAGRAHEVKTRFCVELAGGAKSVATTVTTKVIVRSLPPEWIDAYAATGEGLDKAGAYAIQGRFAFAVERIEGSYTNVVGLPLSEVVSALDALGLSLRLFER